jgi:hypothetical protein
MFRKLFVPSFLILALFSSACSAVATQSPRQIAVQPAGETLIYPSLPYGQFVYNASLVIEVGDPAGAALEAETIALQNGGYLVRSASSWQQDGEVWTRLTLAVPASTYPKVYAELLDLGDLMTAVTSGEWTAGGFGIEAYSEIAVTFQPGGWRWPELSIGNWNPGRTFRQAFGVFTAIFGFLADALIWIMVVGGPFILIALGVRAVWRRLSR